jgi:ribonucleoside-diphosphate reductase alpha chain
VSQNVAKAQYTGVETALNSTGTVPDYVNNPQYQLYKVIRRNGSVVPFEPIKISVAMTKAFLAVEGESGGASARVRDLVSRLTEQVVKTLMRRQPGGGTLHIEDIQDQVELALMRAGEHEVARSYVLYREARAKERAERAAAIEKETAPSVPVLHMTLADGSRVPLDQSRLRTVIEESCTGLGNAVSIEAIFETTLKTLYDGVPEEDVFRSTILSARTLLERDPAYAYATARLLLDQIRREVIGEAVTHAEMTNRYPTYFADYIKRGVEAELISPALAEFDLERLGKALKPERDLQFQYLGLQILYDRYFIHIGGRRIELPQAFWMRVAMGLAINEEEREERAIEFYDLLSSFNFVSSTPTLFNSGTNRPQLSSCFLTTVSDDLISIYEAIKENALLSKFSGGLGNDWTPVRALGSHIKGTNGKSQGVVPFLKVVNDTAVAVNQCFDPDTLIYTANGTRPIRDVKVGDLVLGKSGIYREVTNKFHYNQHDPMVSIKVKHSLEAIQVTTGHPFYAIRNVPMEQSISRTKEWIKKSKVKGEWVEAGELQTGDYVAQVVPKEIVPVAGLSDEDARLYGILLGDGHLCKNGAQWGVAGNPQRDSHLIFVREYLQKRGIHFWENVRGETYLQISWSAGLGAVRDGSTGRIVGSSGPSLPFSRNDIYDSEGRKHISRRFSHLPKSQTLALIQGLLETDGCVSRGQEITFTNSSRPLIDGLRYQLLRLGVPTAGQYRERSNAHVAHRQDGSEICFNGTSSAYDLRIPATPEIANLVGCRPIKKFNWLEHEGHIFSRVRKVERIPVKPFVVDLEVDVDESYMTTAGLAHNGGKRKGAVCAYMETWHLDIEEFLELRKNTGDDRRRTHDMNTANWIPDLFMERVMANSEWTLFSPNEVSDLHDLYGAAFNEAYKRYEALAEQGKIKQFKKIPALQLWRKILSMLFETGHPWITFKDPCNLRSPQQHMGVVHSSNLCTEITLNTSETETAVCNLGSINLVAHLKDGSKDGDLLSSIDQDKLARTCRIAMRMLDNVIDINYYSVDKARNSNLKHRPVGLGVMGFQDALLKLRIPYASEAAVEFADYSQESISYHAIMASSSLARERGKYESYEGSLWSKGILPQDSLDIVEKSRNQSLGLSRVSRLDWRPVREHIKQYGMRNSNCLAIAPTATISNIIGVSQSIEPTYQNLYVKSNMSGDFTVLNSYLVKDLMERGLWDEVMVHDLKYFDGSVMPIDRIPSDLKPLYATAFEVDPKWLIEAGARRQKWIDQSQSLNLYIAEPSGRKLDETYKLAWVRGLKTTYYLRTLGATAAEKSTIQSSALNAVKTGSIGTVPTIPVVSPMVAASTPNVCSITDPECEACQ